MPRPRHRKQITGDALICPQEGHGVHMVGQHPHRPGKHPGDGQQNLRVSLHLRLQRETVNDHNLTAGDCDGRGDSGEFVKERRFPKDIARFVDSQDFLTAILRVEKDLILPGGKETEG